jgi:hypothetical protein
MDVIALVQIIDLYSLIVHQGRGSPATPLLTEFCTKIRYRTNLKLMQTIILFIPYLIL